MEWDDYDPVDDNWYEEQRLIAILNREAMTHFPSLIADLLEAEKRLTRLVETEYKNDFHNLVMGEW